MSGTAWLAALGIVTAAPDGSQRDAAPIPYQGVFDAPPAELWKVPLPGPVVPSATHTELGGPTLHGPYVYVGSAGADALFVLDRRTGQVVRELPAGAPVETTPVVQGGDLLYA
ncbi:MAG: PQQ-binding-like beta-propeller repeat protein, partial [Myxococcota bacterium]|nr:PQQ-binding-like beta-propeller repeat protein [Myxococcota bacterium]